MSGAPTEASAGGGGPDTRPEGMPRPSPTEFGPATGPGTAVAGRQGAAPAARASGELSAVVPPDNARVRGVVDVPTGARGMNAGASIHARRSELAPGRPGMGPIVGS